MSARASQPYNAELPMDETVSGTTAFFMALQFLNALVSIFSTPDGRIASGKDSQPENAEFPIGQGGWEVDGG